MIIASAIKFIPHFRDYPVIICGKRHADCLEEAFDMGYEWDKEELIQGFLTDDNRFLDRYDAKIEARKCRSWLKIMITLENFLVKIFGRSNRRRQCG